MRIFLAILALLPKLVDLILWVGSTFKERRQQKEKLKELKRLAKREHDKIVKKGSVAVANSIADKLND